MIGVFAVINLIFVFLSWKWSKEAFSVGNNFGGWINLVASAVNAAAFANIIL